MLRITKNDHEKGLINGELATVKRIHSEHIEIERKDGKTFQLDRQKALHLEHGYASTVHASQGKTSERVLVEANTRSLTSARDNYYVAISRAKQGATLYTNDKRSLPEAMSRENGKEAALEVGEQKNTGKIVAKEFENPSKEQELER